MLVCSKNKYKLLFVFLTKARHGRENYTWDYIGEKLNWNLRYCMLSKDVVNLQHVDTYLVPKFMGKQW